MVSTRKRRSGGICAPSGAPLRTVSYLRVSTSEQADSGAGISAQRSAISEAVARKGWTLVGEFVDAGVSGKSLTGRPALSEALDVVRLGAADLLVVAKLDRLSRSVEDFAKTLRAAGEQGWALVVLDIDLDMSSPSGELMAHIVSAMSQYERRLIGTRTRDALAAKKAAGVRLGRPPVLPAEVVRRIVRERAAGATMAAIAAALTADGVPTARGGGRWYASAVHSVLDRTGRSTVPV